MERRTYRVSGSRRPYLSQGRWIRKLVMATKVSRIEEQHARDQENRGQLHSLEGIAFSDKLISA